MYISLYKYYLYVNIYIYIFNFYYYFIFFIINYLNNIYNMIFISKKEKTFIYKLIKLV